MCVCDVVCWFFCVVGVWFCDLVFGYVLVVVVVLCGWCVVDW